MKPVYLIAIAIFAVGFGVWKVLENKNKQDMLAQLAAIEEANAISETKPKLEGVNEDELEYRGVYPLIAHLKGSDIPYSGKWFILYENGNKKLYGNFKDGKEDGLQTSWYINGQKSAEVNFKDGKGNGLLIWWHPNGQKKFERMEKNGSPVEGSIKFWNSKGEPVADLLEAEGIR
jgi:hypothetical protein